MPRGDAAVGGALACGAPPGRQPEVVSLPEQQILNPEVSAEPSGTSHEGEVGQMKRDPTAARLLDAEGAVEPSTRHDLARGRQEGQTTQSSAEYATAALLPSGNLSTASRLPAPPLLIPRHGRAAMLTHGVARQEVMLMTNAAIARVGDGMRHGATRPVSRPTA
jgi:hypothetical protein